jgi:CRP-like cAMP-binding protein
MWLRFLSIDLAFRISISEYTFELGVNSFYLQIRVDIVFNERQHISEKGGCRLIIYSSATVEVMEDSKILVVSPDTFETLLKNSPEIAMKMLKEMVLRLRALDDKLEQVLSEIPKGPDLAP